MNHHSSDIISLTRDVEGIAIPAGTKVFLPEGQQVIVTQTLGGNFTIMASGQLFRINAEHADALGLEAVQEELKSVVGEDGKFNEELVWDKMRNVFDPEIPVNIVDLGLIYSFDAKLIEGEQNKFNLSVVMTLTAPGCGMGQILADDVKAQCEAVPGVREANVELTFEPPWNQGMMTEAARLQLGLM